MSFITIILFVIGVGLVITGRVRFADLDAQGTQVRAAGMVLMVPLATMFILGILAGALTRGDAEGVSSALSLLFVIEIITWMAAVAVAYFLLYAKSGVKFDMSQFRISDFLGVTSPQSSINSMQRNTQPSIMTVQQAARYLGVSETHILEAIKAGRLAASKSPQKGYSIARMVLDEYREEHQKKS